MNMNQASYRKLGYMVILNVMGCNGKKTSVRAVGLNFGRLNQDSEQSSSFYRLSLDYSARMILRAGVVLPDS